MSINITVAVPLETLAAFSGGTGRQAATEAVTNSVIESLEAIPYTITPRAVITDAATDAEVQSVSSFTEDGGTPTPTSTSVGCAPPLHIGFVVRTLTGKIIRLGMWDDTDWSEVASAIEDKEGYPPGHFKLIYDRKLFWYGGHEEEEGHPYYTLRQSGITQGAIVGLVLTLRGS